MRNKLPVFSLLVVSQMVFADLGFVAGNEMTSVSVAGDVSLTCASNNGGPAQTVAFQCRDTILLPQEYDHFIGPQNTGADQVELVVTRSDGTVRTKQVAYNSGRGISESKFNLWVNSIFQWPLLSLGENKAIYKLSRNGLVIKQGDFMAKVKIGGFNQCQPSQFYSNNPVDCSQPYTYCQRFFQEKNYCQ